MKILIANINDDLAELKKTAALSFSETPDSSLEEWFSFEYMVKMISEDRGLCLKAVDDDNGVIGMIYAQQENPINGKEGIEKWSIIFAGVIPSESGKGVGGKLLEVLERELILRKIKKLFVFTNTDDDKVINFYRKYGYQDAGSIRDYQYGDNNSAIFLLKYLT